MPRVRVSSLEKELRKVRKELRYWLSKAAQAASHGRHAHAEEIHRIHNMLAELFEKEEVLLGELEWSQEDETNG